MPGTTDKRHYRRSLGMQRHYTPPHGGGSIDAQRTANPNPVVDQHAIDNNQSGIAMQSRPPTYQGQLPVGGRGGDRQETQ